MDMPNDPVILLSYVNTLLRDNYKDIEQLCDDRSIDADQLKQKLSGIGYSYDRDQNRFN